jgi:molecular chaperone GrpE
MNSKEKEINDSKLKKESHKKSEKTDGNNEPMKEAEIKSEKSQTNTVNNTFNEYPNDIIVEKSTEEGIAELKEQILRKTAEIENMRRRVLKEKNELIEYSNQILFSKLLPIIDDFEKAINAGNATVNNDNNKSFLHGFELIYNKLKKIFNESGVKKMEINPGDDFNVDYHEAILQMPSDDFEEGKIIEVAENGYLFNDRVLRHAKIITSSGSNKE